MPRHTGRITESLKACIPALHRDGYKIQQICDILTVKKSLVYKTLALFSNHSNPHKYSRFSRRRTISLDELQQELFSKRGVHASLSTLARAVKRLHIAHKINVTAPAPERNEVLRARHHFANMVELARAYLIFNVNTSSEAFATPYFLDGIITYDIIEGPVTGKRFLQFLKDHVMPFTTPYPGPRSVVVMDNCSIHYGEEVRKLVEDMNLCKLIFLPPYSPNYNPIEQAFSSIEAYLHPHQEDMTLMAMVRLAKASGYI